MNGIARLLNYTKLQKEIRQLRKEITELNQKLTDLQRPDNNIFFQLSEMIIKNYKL